MRYVILLARGDIRRPTTVMSFTNLFRQCGSGFSVLLEKSIWLSGTKSRQFYCSIRFRNGQSIGWRYDSDLMSPANDAAIKVDKILRSMVKKRDVVNINWSGDMAVVLSNWNVLHGRGPEPPKEGIRIIERLYVR